MRAPCPPSSPCSDARPPVGGAACGRCQPSAGRGAGLAPAPTASRPPRCARRPATHPHHLAAFRLTLAPGQLSLLGESGRCATRPGCSGFAPSRSSPLRGDCCAALHIPFACAVPALGRLSLNHRVSHKLHRPSRLIRFPTRSLLWKTGRDPLPLGYFGYPRSGAKGPVDLWKTLTGHSPPVRPGRPFSDLSPQPPAAAMNRPATPP